MTKKSDQRNTTTNSKDLKEGKLKISFLKVQIVGKNLRRKKEKKKVKNKGQGIKRQTSDKWKELD